MTGRTRFVLALLALLLLFSAALPAASALGEREVTWNDYRTPLTGVPVLFSEPTIIWVYLPEEFLKGRSQVTLVWTVMSRVSSAIEGKMRPSFEFCQPQLHIGQGWASGRYDPPVDPRSGLATLRLEVKTKHLKPGKNKIKAMCETPQGFECFGIGCQMVITEMYFPETIKRGAAAAGEDSAQREEKLKVARQWAETCAFKYFLDTLRSRVSSELPQNVQSEADRILNSRDWDPLKANLSRFLAEICKFQVVQTLAEALAASDCDKVNREEPCLAAFHGFLTTMMENEISLLTLELKKKFPDL